MGINFATGDIQGGTEYKAGGSPASAATTYSFTSLSIGAGESYLLVYSVDNAVAAENQLSIYVNSDTTATNYYSQYLSVNGAGVSGGRENTSRFDIISASKHSAGMILIQLDAAGILRATAFNQSLDASAVRSYRMDISKTAATNPITQIDITGNQANGLDTGSVFKLYQLTNT